MGYDFIVLLGFFIGTVLYSVLFFEVLKRQNKLVHEYVFLALIVVFTCWHGLQFLNTLIKQVFGREAVEVYSELHYWALYSVALFPPLTVHLHMAFYDHVRRQFGRRGSAFRILPWFFYLPILVIMYFGQYTIIDYRRKILAESLSFIPAFVAWIVVCLLASAFLSVLIFKINRNEKWKQFFVVEIVILVLLAVALTYLYFLGGTGIVSLDKAAKNLIKISAIVPTAVLIYLMYKYPFFSSVAKRRFIIVTISGAFLVIFIMTLKFLRKFGEENPDINVALVEIIAASLIFLLYEPVKYLIRRLAGYYALNQKYLYQGMIRNMSEKIVNAGNMADLASTAQHVIVDSLNVEQVALFQLSHRSVAGGESYSVMHAFGDTKDIDATQAARRIEASNGIYVARKRPFFHLRTSEIPYQVYVGITLSNELVGILAVGKKKTNEDFSLEEKELLLTLASQIALAIENIELMQRRMELEARIYQADKLSSLGLLATSIAHEVKNPLSSIKSIVQSMHDDRIRRGDRGEEQQDLEIITEEINRLSAVVGQLLKFARPDQADLLEVDLIRVIDTILTILRQEMRSKSVRAFTKFDARSLIIQSRQGDLKEILFNLIINGIQSMENGGRLLIQGGHVVAADCPFDCQDSTDSVLFSDTLFIDEEVDGYFEWRMEPFHASPIDAEEMTAERPPGDFIRLVVTDTGPGIEREHLRDIFRPFFTTKSFGTGLGLSIVKNKVEALKGKLVVRSQPGVGTSFELYIPVYDGSRHE